MRILALLGLLAAVSGLGACAAPVGTPSVEPPAAVWVIEELDVGGPSLGG